MIPPNPFLEAHDSQASALALLKALGYVEVAPEEAVRQRRGRSRVVLREVLHEQLGRLNAVEYRGQTVPFSEAGLDAALEALDGVEDRGEVVRTAEAVYDLLLLGKSVEQTVGGDRKSFTVRYIDWARPERNVYHVTHEFAVRGPDGTLRRADVVAFVNGIPFLAIECKRRDVNDGLGMAVADVAARNDEMPRLMATAQIAIGANGHDLRYGTAGTLAKYYAPWREFGHDLTPEVADLLGHRPSGQDVALYALARPARLLELVQHFTLFDGAEKKVARHQQYFAVQQTVARVRRKKASGGRCGGIIWHTQGSGKSITMVFLFNALARIETGARVVLVTDRINLDRQIAATFHRNGLDPQKAKTGAHLVELIEDRRARVITTVIDKFFRAVDRHGMVYEGDDLYVLVDEAHRSQFGRKNIQMQRALPGACLLGFTGTPIVKADRNVLQQFGDFIHLYTLRDALDDQIVVPLLYESFMPQLSIHREVIDRKTDRVLERADPYQAERAKEWASRRTRFFESQGGIEEIAMHIARHFREQWRGTGLKAQLTVPLRDTALRYLQAFENEPVPEDEKIRAAVVISPQAEPASAAEATELENDRIRAFWDEKIKKHGSPEAYEREVVESFTHDRDGYELLIVVDKLLTGFDAPRNTVLYVAKSLSGHTLLQAIARVNRVYPGKDAGFIVDYYGIKNSLREAIEEYEELASKDGIELAETILDVSEEVDKLPDVHAALLAVFAGAPVDIRQRREEDREELLEYLRDTRLRDDFKERLSAFGRLFRLATATLYFHETEPLAKQEPRYRADLAFFHSLYAAAQNKYEERTDHRQYHPMLRQILDRHVGIEDIVLLNERPLNIFDPGAFTREIDRATEKASTGSKAETMANQLKRVLTLRMDEDRVRYRRFSELLEAAIERYRQFRLDAQNALEIEQGGEAFLAAVKGLYDELVHGGQSVPPRLRNHPDARAYYSVVDQAIRSAVQGGTPPSEAESGALPPIEGVSADRLAQAALDVEAIIREHQIRDWQNNPTAISSIKDAVEDSFLGLSHELNVALSFDAIDLALDDLIQIAKTRDA